MLDWQTSAGGCTFTFRAVYMPWLALTWAIAVVSLIVFVIGVVRWRRQRFLASIGLTLVAMTVAGCSTTKLSESSRANVIFASLFVTCLVALACGLVILVVSSILTLVRHEMPKSRVAAGIVAMVMSLVTMGLSVRQIMQLGDGHLPLLELPSAVGFHVGQARHVKPELYLRTDYGEKGPFVDGSWTVDEVVFEATAPGVVERTATARSGRFTVSTKVKAKAHRDEGNPYLSLRVGNEWHYEVTTTTKHQGMRYFLFFRGKPSAEAETMGVVFAIEPAPPRDGWREYTLVMKRVRGDELLLRHIVRPVDGETYFYDQNFPAPDEPNPAAIDPRNTLQVLLEVYDGDPTSSVRSCRLGDVGAGQCQLGGATEDVLPPPSDDPAAKKEIVAKKAGQGSAEVVLVPARVPTQYALAGPSRLTTKWKVGETLSALINIATVVATVGSMIPGGTSGDKEYVLMRTVRGSGPP